MIINIVEIVNKNLIKKAKNNDRDYTHFHPSEWDGCKRKIAYEYYESRGYITVDESALKIDPQLERIFGNGHSLHDRWKSYLLDTGALMGVWKCEYCKLHSTKTLFGEGTKTGCLKPEKCNVCGFKFFEYHEIGLFDEATMWGGHVDAVLDQCILSLVYGSNVKLEEDEKKIAVDFKSMNSYEFATLEAPKPKHLTQMNIYLYLTGLKYGKFIYEDKNSQSVKEFLVVRDDEMLRIKKEEAFVLKKTVTSLNVHGKRALPIRAFDSITHKECKSCKYRGDCWNKRHEETKITQVPLVNLTTQTSVFSKMAIQEADV